MKAVYVRTAVKGRGASQTALHSNMCIAGTRMDIPGALQQATYT